MKISSFLLVLALTVYLTGITSAQTKDPPGKKIFMDSKCQTCHSVESHELISKSKKPVDLSNVGAIYRANFLEKFLTKKEKINDKMHGQAFKGSDEELNQLAEWLQTLNTGEPTKDKKTGTDTKDTKSESTKDTTSSKK